MIDLTVYDWIVINTSAGKDSQAMTDYVVKECDKQGVPRSRIVALHCDLGLSPKGEPIEWPGTMELAAEHAAHYGIRFIVCKRTIRGFLQEILKRGKWPSNTERYCTSYYKRDQGKKVITQLVKELDAPSYDPPHILNCFGFRAEESPRRAKLKSFSYNERASSGARMVFDWLPIHDWFTKEVWDRIKQAGTRHHPAYDRGMSRLSCRL